MGKKIKVFLILLISVFIVCLAGTGGFLWFKGRSLPKTNGKIVITGIEAPVEIIRDSHGIPHIYAENRHDLFFAQGFVHAQDRFWQMEFWRRVGAGRLSELFGSSQLESDIFLRTMGFTRVAEEEFNSFDILYKEYLEAYSAGVNAWIGNKKPEKIALEFSLLKLTGVEIDIEPWTPINTITWGKVMSYDLNENMDKEKLILNVLRSVGFTTTTDFFSPYRDDMPYIVSKDEYLSYRKQQGLPELEEKLSTDITHNTFTQGTMSEIGSNNWVVSGELTDTGKPILANDMHLGIQMPSIWYENDLHCTGDKPLNVKGFSFAGVPGVIVGHNDNISWGVTNLGVDVQDLYIEKLHIEDPDMYLKNDEWVPMEIIHESIEIEGEEDPYVLRVRNTEHGPVISDFGSFSNFRGFMLDEERVFPDNYNLTALSLKWTALSPGYILKAVLMLNEAENYDDFRDALSFWDGPGQSFVYSDKAGNIAYQMTGKTPIRIDGTGVGPMPGWIDDYEWQGFIPFEEMPASFNPEKGYIVTANNPVIDDFYPYYISSGFSYGYRAKRISQLIEADKDGISISDMKNIHGDVYNLSADEIIPFIANMDIETAYRKVIEIPEDETAKEIGKREKLAIKELKTLNQAFDILNDWNRELTRESAGAAVYGYFWRDLANNVFVDQFPEDQWPAKSIVRYENTLLYILKDRNNSWWDDWQTPDKVENADDILEKSYIKGILEGIDELGYNASKWKWGDVHTAEFRNQTLGESGIGLIENLFNRGPFPVDGGASQVNVTSWRFADPFSVYNIASMREILSMDDLSKSLMIHPTGQSGHPASKHYDDFIPLWQNVEYHKNLWEKDDVLNDEKGTLRLIPE